MRGLRLGRWQWLACVALLAVALPAGAEGQTARVGPPNGKLFIVGGGDMSKLWPEFIALVGGKEAPIVVIPTANEKVEDTDKAVAALRALGVNQVVQLHARDRAMADSEGFILPLRTARGVWLTGGRQWRLADAYLGTKTLLELREVLDRGGVIGGSSAGASIQASYLVRGAPEGNKIMMSPGHEVGFGFLRDTAIDQHVNTRSRGEDILPVLEKHPKLLGIALDEATAIRVQGDRCEVLGAGQVRFFAHATQPAVVLRAGGRYDLAERKVLP